MISGPVVDTLPSGLKVVAGTITGGGVPSADGRSVTWQVTLAPATSLTFFYQAEVVDSEVVDGQVLVNVATFLGLQDTTTHTVDIPAVVAGVEEEVVASEEIAATGANGIGPILTAALLALLAGGLLVVLGRRRACSALTDRGELPSLIVNDPVAVPGPKVSGRAPAALSMMRWRRGRSAISNGPAGLRKRRSTTSAVSDARLSLTRRWG